MHTAHGNNVRWSFESGSEYTLNEDIIVAPRLGIRGTVISSLE
jgi:hypothetical protein